MSSPRSTSDVERILAQDDVKARGVTLGFRYIGGSPDKLAAFLKNETAKWAEVAKKADWSRTDRACNPSSLAL